MTKKYLLSENNITYFAFQLYSIQASFGANQSKNFYDNLKTNYLSHLRFIEALINSGDENISYELRFVVRNQNINTFKKIEIFFICQLENYKNKFINDYLYNIYDILNSTFNEYRFKIIEKNKLKELFNYSEPLFVYSITRRTTIQQLDTLETSIFRKTLGFSPKKDESPLRSATTTSDNDQKSITYIWPFVFPEHKSEDFFSILSNNFVDDFNIRIKLKATKLRQEEENFIGKQIVKCEIFKQARIDTPVIETENIYPTLIEIASIYQQNLFKFLMGLKKNCALMTIEIETKSHLIDPFIHLIASFFSSYEKYNSNDKFFHGGYEIIKTKIDADEIVKSKHNKIIDFKLIYNSILPLEARRLLYCFDAEEAICGFRFPFPPTEFIPNFNLKLFKERIAPSELIEKGKRNTYSGYLIGINKYKGLENEIIIDKEDLKKHMYVIGQTGTGKTTLLSTMILDAINKGEGVGLIDPHGDLFYNILGKIPDDRIKDVVVFDPSDKEYAVGLNILESNSIEQRYFIANEFVGIIRRLIESEYGLTVAREITGPIFYKFLRLMVLLVMSNKLKKGTLLDLYECFSTDDKWEEFRYGYEEDQILDEFIEELSKRDMTKPGSDGISLGDYIGSKLQNFVFNPMLRNIFRQKKSTINFLDIMNSKKILLINLAKGVLTEENSRFLGMLLMTKLMATAMERVKIPEKDRKNFYLFIDEFQNIATTSFTTLLSEARKFGLSLILANQFIEQIIDPQILLSIFGNVGTFICFRLGQIDAQRLEQRFLPYVSAFDLTNLPNWHAYVMTLIEGKNTIPFIIETILDSTPSNSKKAKEVIENSRKNYSVKIDNIKIEFEFSNGNK